MSSQSDDPQHFSIVRLILFVGLIASTTKAAADGGDSLPDKDELNFIGCLFSHTGQMQSGAGAPCEESDKECQKGVERSGWYMTEMNGNASMHQAYGYQLSRKRALSGKPLTGDQIMVVDSLLSQIKDVPEAYNEQVENEAQLTKQPAAQIKEEWQKMANNQEWKKGAVAETYTSAGELSMEDWEKTYGAPKPKVSPICKARWVCCNEMASKIGQTAFCKCN